MPVYNAERYLGEAIESVLKQTYADFELLLINDRSTDRSKEICEEYSKMDGRISLLENDSDTHGPGPARNIGLDHASGEYIIFMDADDWIDDGLLQCAVHRMQEANADIAQFGAIVEMNDGNRSRCYCDGRSGVLTKADIKKNFLAFWQNSLSYVWLHLFRRETIETIRFESIINGEDACYLMDALYEAERIAHITDDIFYHYRCSEGSTSHRWVESTIECLTVQWNHQCRFIKSLMGDSDSLSYAGAAYGDYMWAIYQLSSPFCPLSFREKRKRLLNLSEIIEFDKYRGIYPFEMEHGLMKVKFMLVKYHLEGLILLFGPLYYRMGKMVKYVTRRKK